MIKIVSITPIYGNTTYVGVFINRQEKAFILRPALAMALMEDEGGRRHIEYVYAGRPFIEDDPCTRDTFDKSATHLLFVETGWARAKREAEGYITRPAFADYKVIA